MLSVFVVVFIVFIVIGVFLVSFVFVEVFDEIWLVILDDYIRCGNFLGCKMFGVRLKY